LDAPLDDCGVVIILYINKRGGTLSGSMGNDECTMKALEKNKGTQINKKIA
jgi:hypothetical protein